MGDEVAALVVRLEASINRYQKDLDRARAQTNRRMGQIDKRVKASGASFDGLAGRVKAFAATLTVGKVIAYADSYKSLQNQLRVVTESQAELNELTEELFGVAQRSRGAITDTTATYRTLKQSTDGLGLSQAELIRLTETIQKAAPGASGAVRQLGQALGSGALRGDELNSVLEGAPLIARAVAAEFGVTIGQLRELAAQGEVTTERVVAALKTLGDQADANIAKTELTVTQALTALDNAFTKFIGGQDSALGASKALANGIAALAENLDTVADAFLVISTVMAGRYAGTAVTAAIAGTATLTAGMGGLTAAATASAVATRGLSAALAFFGGPVGLAVTALAGGMYLLSQRTTEAEQAAESHTQAMNAVEAVMVRVATATGDAADAANRDRDAMIANAKASLETARAKLKLVEADKELARVRAASIDAMDPEAANFFSNLLEKRFRELDGTAITRQIQSLEAELQRLNNLEVSTGATSASAKSDGSVSAVKTAPQKTTAKQAGALPDYGALIDAQDAALRAEKALGDFQSERVETARDLLEEEDRIAAVRKAGLDAIAKAREAGLSPEQQVEASKVARETLEAVQRREIALDLLTEKERRLEEQKEAAAQAEKDRVDAALKQQNEYYSTLDQLAQDRRAEDERVAQEALDRAIANQNELFDYLDSLAVAERDNQEKLAKARDDANKALIDGFTSAIAQADSLEDALEGVLRQLFQIAAQGFFEGAFGVEGAGSSGGGLGSAFADIGGNLLGNIFRERGGPVTAGKPYIVGEKRAELFVPNTSGRIVPRVPSNMGGGQSSSQSISIRQGDIILTKGADKSSLREIEKMQRQMADETIAQINRQRLQGIA